MHVAPPIVTIVMHNLVMYMHSAMVGANIDHSQPFIRNNLVTREGWMQTVD